jgi:hypothetical protein
VQIIPWGQPAGKAGVLPDQRGGGALHGFKFYLTPVHEVALPWRGSSSSKNGGVIRVCKGKLLEVTIMERTMKTKVVNK